MARSVVTIVKRETSKETQDLLSSRVCDTTNFAKLAELRTLYIRYMRSICSLYYTGSLSE